MSIRIALVPMVCLAVAGLGAAPQTPSAPDAGLAYLGLDRAREWTYTVTFERPELYYSPYLADMLGSSVTHGIRQMKQTSFDMTWKAVPAGDTAKVAVEFGPTAKVFWFSLSVCAAHLAVHRSTGPAIENHPWDDKGQDTDGEYKPFKPFASALLSLEAHYSPCDKNDKTMDWDLGELLGVVTADGRATVSKLGWDVRPSPEPVTVAAGTFKDVIQSRFSRGDGRYAPVHTVESWFARGVGLIRYRVSKDGKVIYTASLASVSPAEGTQPPSAR